MAPCQPLGVGAVVERQAAVLRLQTAHSFLAPFGSWAVPFSCRGHLPCVSQGHQAGLRTRPLARGCCQAIGQVPSLRVAVQCRNADQQLGASCRRQPPPKVQSSAPELLEQVRWAAVEEAPISGRLSSRRSCVCESPGGGGGGGGPALKPPAAGSTVRNPLLVRLGLQEMPQLKGMVSKTPWPAR